MDTGRQRLLQTMPLHAITSTYGEEGLRERFRTEIADFPDADLRQLERALALASRLHAADRRQREPYVNHLLRVAIRILSHYGIHDADVATAALLHDAVEDHAADLAPGGGQEAALGALRRRFGSRVTDLVRAVTNPVWEPGRDKYEQYREHVAQSLEDCRWARVIKASDFADNGVGLIHTTGPTAERLAGKYAPLIPVLRDMITRPDTPLSPAARQRILDQLDRAEERFSALLPPGQGPGTGVRPGTG